MNRRQVRIISCLSLAIAMQQAVPAMAYRPPAGAVSGVNKLMQGMSDNPDDLAFSPVLLQMAKLIGRTGLSPGFFLQNEGTFSTEPSIDLRTLLLYQAGLIKMPLHILTGKRLNVEKQEPVPTLSFPAIPEPRKGMSEGQSTGDVPSLEADHVPRELERDQVMAPRANVGQPERISLADKARNSGTPQPDSLLSLDVRRLQTELSEPVGDKPEPTRIAADIPHLAMAMPRTNVMPFITRNVFRLWTWRPQAEGDTDADADDGAMPLTAASYNGTFVVATTGAISSITGRHFTLAPGRLLANNQGGELLFSTEMASASVEPEATAVVEVSGEAGHRVVKVYALEAGDGHAVVVTVPGSKPQSYNLAAGEMVVCGDHALSSSELGNYMQERNQLSAQVSRGKFAVSKFIQQELALRIENNAEQYEVLSSLKRRVSEQH